MTVLFFLPAIVLFGVACVLRWRHWQYDQKLRHWHEPITPMYWDNDEEPSSITSMMRSWDRTLKDIRSL